MIKGLKVKLTEIGKIKIGTKGKKNDKGYSPAIKYDHFKIEKVEKDPKTREVVFDTVTMDALGENPTEINIMFPFDKPELNFYTGMLSFKDGKKFCQGDGERASRLDIKSGEFVDQVCNPETCEMIQSKKMDQCKPKGILSCFINKSPYGGAVYKYRTHGWNSIQGLFSALDYYHDLTGGITQGLPGFKLIFLKKHTEKHGNVGIVTLTYEGGDTKLKLDAIKEKQRRAKLSVDITKIEKNAVESGFFEDKDSQEDIQQEFYKDNNSEDMLKTQAQAITEKMKNPESQSEPEKKPTM